MIARLKLRLHRHAAAGCGPDERVALRDVRMGGKLPRYVGVVAKYFWQPFINTMCSMGGNPSPALRKPDATGHSASRYGLG